MSFAVSLDASVVVSALRCYEKAFALKVASKKPKIAAELKKIDGKLRKELPGIIRARTPPCILGDELRLVEALWSKMERNTDQLDAQRQHMVIGTLALLLIVLCYCIA